MVVQENKEEKKIMLTKSVLQLANELDSEEGGYKAPNLLQRLLSVFKNVRLGSDITHFQMPPPFNIPKSQLQYTGESVYCSASDLLSTCNREQNPVDRLIYVVAWFISSTRPVTFGVAPYNPILGETHHVSKGNLNVLVEQVSHHPPVTALHATDDKENIEMIWWQQPVPIFYGTSVEGKINGKGKLKLLNHGETYEMNSANLLYRVLPVPSVDWVGTVNLRCLETGLVAELSYKSSPSFLGLGGNHKVIKGKIFDSSSSKALYELDGQWDRTIKLKDRINGEVRVIYDATKGNSGLLILKNEESVWPTESLHVWGELSQAIMRKDWDKAREAKQAVEERQRKLMRERESKGEKWIPKHFEVSHSKEVGWDCSPIQNFVSAAPIKAFRK
ncbi:oxysterol-binding protein-related protein 4C-like isoform X3 [Trifolium pratense]|nr:oxysterol-binding protein-related protein 4C-like isoform X1 [Trifolium pratense]XP_045788977.1 oxysterol-binding protein-related protein 4C-like isoform X3 [Trifolium pratense]